MNFIEKYVAANGVHVNFCNQKFQSDLPFCMTIEGEKLRI